mgnify:CR=1 FL=1|tara:strand:+ start:2823 stop:3329 length:507 start_codon:yes stop_codon:yes gene_type:complete
MGAIEIVVIVVALSVIAYFIIKSKKKKNSDKSGEVINYTPVLSDLTQVESDILTLVNNHRSSLELKLVSPEKKARTMAFAHCDYMRENGAASHNNFFTRKNELVKYGAKDVGENVAYGYTTANSLFNAYLNSEGHRKVIEGPIYDYIGIRSIKDTKGKYYNTLLFVNF